MMEMVTIRKKRSWTDLEKLMEIKTSIHSSSNHKGKLAHGCEVTAKKALGIRIGKCLENIFRFFHTNIKWVSPEKYPTG